MLMSELTFTTRLSGYFFGRAHRVAFETSTFSNNDDSCEVVAHICLRQKSSTGSNQTCGLRHKNFISLTLQHCSLSGQWFSLIMSSG